jgi:hypothetical protein
LRALAARSAGAASAPLAGRARQAPAPSSQGAAGPGRRHQRVACRSPRVTAVPACTARDVILPTSPARSTPGALATAYSPRLRERMGAVKAGRRGKKTHGTKPHGTKPHGTKPHGTKTHGTARATAGAAARPARRGARRAVGAPPRVAPLPLVHYLKGHRARDDKVAPGWRRRWFPPPGHILHILAPHPGRKDLLVLSPMLDHRLSAALRLLPPRPATASRRDRLAGALAQFDCAVQHSPTIGPLRACRSGGRRCAKEIAPQQASMPNSPPRYPGRGNAAAGTAEAMIRAQPRARGRSHPGGGRLAPAARRGQ